MKQSDDLGVAANRAGGGAPGKRIDYAGDYRALYGLEESRRSGVEEPFLKSQTLGQALDSAKPIKMNLETEADEEHVDSGRERDRLQI